MRVGRKEHLLNILSQGAQRGPEKAVCVRQQPVPLFLCVCTLGLQRRAFIQSSLIQCHEELNQR